MFQPLSLRRITLPHRILRAATFENMADAEGRVTDRLAGCYEALARGGAGTIITGFTFFTRQGRCMQPFQAGIADEGHVEAWKRVIDRVKAAEPGVKLFLQVAHTGRQTGREATGSTPVGAGPVRCTYFLSRVRTLREDEVPALARGFGEAVARAERAGFDGVQIHAAHGYLIHQFLSPHTNRRSDRYGQDRTLFLKEVLAEARARSGLPILLKMSGSEDARKGVRPDLVREYVREIARWDAVDAIEVSYGTMEIAFNIIRGGHPLDPVLIHNRLFTRFGPFLCQVFKKFIFPFYRQRFLPYEDLYNLENAVRIKAGSDLPILVTGGIRSKGQIREILGRHGLDGVTLCRPFVREPDLVRKFREHDEERSTCTSCNMCTVMSDSPNPLRCYLRK